MPYRPVRTYNQPTSGISLLRLHVAVDAAVDEPGDLLPGHLSVGRRVDPLEHRLQVRQLLHS